MRDAVSKKPGAITPHEADKNEQEPQRDLAEEVERQIGPLVQANIRKEVVQRVVMMVQEEAYRGPIPHPRHMAEYERICPGAADRLISIAEDVARFNMAEASKQQSADNADVKLGMILGFSALIAMIASAVACAWMGHTILAGGFVTAGALGIVGRFIKGRFEN